MHMQSNRMTNGLAKSRPIKIGLVFGRSHLHTFHLSKQSCCRPEVGRIWLQDWLCTGRDSSNLCILVKSFKLGGFVYSDGLFLCRPIDPLWEVRSIRASAIADGQDLMNRKVKRRFLDHSWMLIIYTCVVQVSTCRMGDRFWDCKPWSPHKSFSENW